MQNLYFITGFMGTGKSTLLQSLKTRFEMNEDILIDSVSHSLSGSVEEDVHQKYVILEDLDAYIEKKIDRSISDYFTKEGEDAFRRLEASCLEEIFARTVLKKEDYPTMEIHVAISLGGGCIFSYETRKTILRFAQLCNQVHCFNLFTAIDIITQRLQGSEGAQRPLANQLQEKYTQRTEFWPVISEILQHNDISVTEIQSNASKQDIFHSVLSTINQSVFVNAKRIDAKKNTPLNSKIGIPLLEMPW